MQHHNKRYREHDGAEIRHQTRIKTHRESEQNETVLCVDRHE